MAGRLQVGGFERSELNKIVYVAQFQGRVIWSLLDSIVGFERTELNRIRNCSLCKVLCQFQSIMLNVPNRLSYIMHAHVTGQYQYSAFPSLSFPSLPFPSPPFPCPCPGPWGGREGGRGGPRARLSRVCLPPFYGKLQSELSTTAILFLKQPSCLSNLKANTHRHEKHCHVIEVGVVIASIGL